MDPVVTRVRPARRAGQRHRILAGAEGRAGALDSGRRGGPGIHTGFWRAPRAGQAHRILAAPRGGRRPGVGRAPGIQPPHCGSTRGLVKSISSCYHT